MARPSSWLARNHFSARLLRAIILLFFLIFVTLNVVIIAQRERKIATEELATRRSQLAGFLWEYMRVSARVQTVFEALSSNLDVLGWLYAQREAEDFFLLNRIQNQIRSLEISSNRLVSISIYRHRTHSLISDTIGFKIGRNFNSYKYFDESFLSDFLSSGSTRRVETGPLGFYHPIQDKLVFISYLPIGLKLGSLVVTYDTTGMLDHFEKGSHLYLLVGESVVHMSRDAGDLRIDDSVIVGTALVRNDASVRNNEDRSFYVVTEAHPAQALYAVLLVPQPSVAWPRYLLYAVVAILSAALTSLLPSIAVYLIVTRSLMPLIRRIPSPGGPELHRALEFDRGLILLENTVASLIESNSQWEIDDRNALDREMRNLLFGRECEQRFLRERLSLLGGGERSLFHVMIVHAEISDVEQNMEEAIGRIRSGVNEVIAYPNYAVRTDINSLAYVIRAPREACHDYFGLRGSSLIERVYIAISDPQEDLATLYLAYERAVQLLNSRFYDPGRRVYLFDGSGEVDSDIGIPFDLLQAYLLSLRSLDINRCSKVIDTIFEDLPTINSPIMLSLLSCIIQVAKENRIEAKRVLPFNLYRMLGSCRSNSELKHQVFLYSHSLIQLVVAESHRYKKDTLSGILDHIDRNFRSSISLKGLADRFHCSSAYISRLIKKDLTIGFNEYLNRLRVSEGSRLLLDTTKTAKEIAREVGYDTEHSFIRNFKKLVGKTPMEFKNAATLPLPVYHRHDVGLN